MTNSEFKAWFDGFTEAMDGIPSKKQWDRIKARVKEIDGASVNKYYIDRYWPGGYPYWGIASGHSYAYAANSCAQQQANVSNSLAGLQGNNGLGQVAAAQSFNTQGAMYALGQLEALK